MSGFLSMQGWANTSAMALAKVLGEHTTKEGKEVEIFESDSGHSISLCSSLSLLPSLMPKVSGQLGCAAILLAIGEGAYWEYKLYRAGVERDKSPKEIAALKGNPHILAEDWPSLHSRDIARYLVHTPELSEADQQEKAYPEDNAELWDCWVLADFAHKLGIPYPIDDAGNEIFPVASNLRLPAMTI